MNVTSRPLKYYTDRQMKYQNGIRIHGHNGVHRMQGCEKERGVQEQGDWQKEGPSPHPSNSQGHLPGKQPPYQNMGHPTWK